MKHYGKLVPIGMVVLMVFSWFSLVKDTLSTENQYDTYLKKARENAEKGLTKYAAENYAQALSIHSSPEIYAEVAAYYKSQNRIGDYESWSEGFFELYPTEPMAYDCIIDAYLMQQGYEDVYEILDVAEKRNITSEYIDKVREDLMYVYRFDYNTYENVGIYSNNFSPVMEKGYWGFVNRYGDFRIATKYLEVGYFTASNFCPVVNQNGDSYFIDKEGNKVKVSDEPYLKFGSLVEGKTAAQKEDGRFTYLDEDLKPLFGDYEYAGTFNCGIAAVKEGNGWQLIKDNGEILGNQYYLDVKLDEKQIACRKDRLFVSVSEGKYILINNKGKQIGNQEYEDANVFLADGIASVKIDGQWCFIDENGKRISDHTYENARPFSNGLAAVCIDGKWGFVDQDENIVIEPEFYDSKDFNELGSCFVKTGDEWQLLRLYRLNRD